MHISGLAAPDQGVSSEEVPVIRFRFNRTASEEVPVMRFRFNRNRNTGTVE